MPLSDCQPVVGSDGVVRWYVTDNSAPTIYAVNPFAQSSLYMKGDVDENGKKLRLRIFVLFCAAYVRK